MKVNKIIIFLLLLSLLSISSCKKEKDEEGELCVDGKFTVLLYDYNKNLMDIKIYNNFDDYYNNFNVKASSTKREGYINTGWKFIDYISEIDHNNEEIYIGAKYIENFVQSYDKIWENLSGLYYGQSEYNIDFKITIDNENRKIIYTPDGYPAYEFEGLILAPGDGTYFLDNEWNIINTEEYFYDFENKYIIYLYDYDYVYITINDDGTITQSGLTYSKNKISNDSLKILIKVFPYKEWGFDHNEYHGMAYYSGLFGEYSLIYIYDYFVDMKYVEYLDMVQVDLTFYYTVNHMVDTNYVCFYIIVTAGRTMDPPIIEKVPIIQHANIGDNYRQELTFFFDVDDVLEYIVIEEANYDL